MHKNFRSAAIGLAFCAAAWASPVFAGDCGSYTVCEPDGPCITVDKPCPPPPPPPPQTSTGTATGNPQ